MEQAELYNQIRHRIEREDDLLNARTNIFLVLNGLAAVAVGLDTGTSYRLTIAIVSSLLNLLWIACSFQSVGVLLRLTQALVQLCPGNTVENIVQSTLSKRLWQRPNAILSVYMPLIVTIVWFVTIFLVTR